MVSEQKKRLLTRSVTVPAVYDQVHEVDFWEDVYDTPVRGELRGKLIGRRLMRGRVHVQIDMSEVVRRIGRAAIWNKSKKSHDGPIKVVSIKDPYEVRMTIVSPADNQETF